MGFVTTSLLFGALGVAVPVALHLVMRQQPRRLEFPALRFLQQQSESNRRRLRLRHLILLALRMAAIALVAFALARPTISGSGLLGGGEAPVAAALLFDTAPRMDLRHENSTRLEAAQELAEWLLSQLPPGSELAVFDGRAAGAAFAVDAAAAGQRIGRLKITPDGRPLPELLTTALDLLETSELPRKEVYVFTDRTAAAWEGTETSDLSTRLEADEQLALYVVDVGVDGVANVGLGELRLARESIARSGGLELSAEVERIGDAPRRGVELLLLDKARQLQKRGAQSPAADAPVVTFQVAGLAAGTHQGVLRLEGEDSLTWDDVRYFSVEVAPAWRVLVAAAEVENALLLTEALAPEAFRQTGQARFECTIVEQGALATADLSAYDAVALLDPRPPSDATWQQLADFASAGGGVAVFLGRNAQPAEAFNTESAQRLLAAPLKRVWRETTWLAPADLSHPLLAAFRPLASSVPWRSFPVLKHWQLGPLAADAQVVLPYADGQAALVERGLGRGRTLTMTTPVSDPVGIRNRQPWNLLPTALEPWPFVMLANESLLYLVGSSETRLNYRVGEVALVRAPRDGPPPLVSITTPDGDRIRQPVDPRHQSIAVAATTAPGNYRLQAGGDLDRGFSVNLPGSATRLARIGRDELDAALGADNYRYARNRREIDRVVNVGRVGRELFPYVILLVALVLAVEHVMSNAFYGRRG